MLTIQDQLTNMVTYGTLKNGTRVRVTLRDICAKPFAPNNTNCSIISVLEYFQSSLANLDYTEIFGLVNNSYHIHWCTR